MCLRYARKVTTVFRINEQKDIRIVLNDIMIHSPTCSNCLKRITAFDYSSIVKETTHFSLSLSFSLSLFLD